MNYASLSAAPNSNGSNNNLPLQNTNNFSDATYNQNYYPWTPSTTSEWKEKFIDYKNNLQGAHIIFQMTKI